MGISSKRGITVLLILFLANCVYAQRNNCNVFIRGNYLEVGTNWNGAYGSSIPPPAGYHPDTMAALHNQSLCGGAITADSAIGFVADIDKDGWNTGTPKYYGDYILAGGTPHEGWSFMADGNQVNGWNSDAASSDTINGITTTAPPAYYSTTGDSVIGQWQGTFNGIQLTQFTILDTSKLFFTVIVYVDNTNLAESHNIYYLRTIKPNNDELTTGSFLTKNKIEYQLPDSANATVVSATGTIDTKAYVALGSGNPNAKCFMIKNSATPQFNTLDNIYAGDTNYVYAAGDSLTNTSGIGIVFFLPDIPSGSFDTFSFVYAFTPGALVEGLGINDSTATTDTSHVGVKTTVSQTSYAVYPNPCKGVFTIAGMQRTQHISLYDLLGRDFSQCITGNGTNVYNTGALPAGMYVLLVRDSKGAVVFRTPFRKE